MNENKTNKFGRKPILSGGKKYDVFLDQPTVENARKIGDGNISKGIRTAVNEFVEIRSINDERPLDKNQGIETQDIG